MGLGARRLGQLGPCGSGESPIAHETSGRGDVRREVPVVVEHRNSGSQQLARRFQAGTGQERAMEFASLRGGKKLDPDDLSEVLHHREKPARTMR